MTLRHLCAVFLLLALPFAGAPANAQSLESVDWAALPTDEEALKELDQRQLREVRRVVRQCAASNSVGLVVRRNQFNPCVASELDNYIRQYGDPALQAFHFAMPRRDRYDQQRSYVAISRLEARRQTAINKGYAAPAEDAP